MGEVGRNLVAQDTLDHIEIVINERRRLAAFRTALDLVPKSLEEADVGPKLVFGCALGGGAYDEASMAIFTLAHHDALQAEPLIFGGNFARDTGVVHGRHVDQESSRQRNVAGDARTLLTYGFLRNLHQDFLAFLEKIGNERCGLSLEVAARAKTATTPATTAAATTIPCWTWGRLLISGSAGRRTNFGASVHRAVAASFGIK